MTASTQVVVVGVRASKTGSGRMAVVVLETERGRHDAARALDRVGFEVEREYRLTPQVEAVRAAAMAPRPAWSKYYADQGVLVNAH